MEKTSAGFQKAQITSTRERTHSRSIQDVGRNEYLSKLTSLRDSLVNQEQLCFVNALKRLGMTSLLDKPNSFRLRMNKNDTSKPSPPPMRMNMLYTAEKYQLMREQQEKPLIVPLVGKQIFCPNTNISKNEPVYPAESSSEISGHGGDICESSSPLGLSKVEAILQNDLLHFPQTTSRFPHIDKESRKRKECIYSKMKYMLNTRSNIFNQTSNNVAYTFLPDLRLVSVSSQPSTHSLPECRNDTVPCKNQPGVSARVLPIIDARTCDSRSVIDAEDMDILENYCVHESTDFSVFHNDETRANCTEKNTQARGQARRARLYKSHGCYSMQPLHVHQIVLENKQKISKVITESVADEIHRNIQNVTSSNKGAIIIPSDIAENSSRATRHGFELSLRMLMNSNDFCNSDGESEDVCKNTIVAWHPTIRNRMSIKEKSKCFYKDSMNVHNALNVSKITPVFDPTQANNVKKRARRLQANDLGHIDQHAEARTLERHKMCIVIDIPNVTQCSSSLESEYSCVDEIAD